MSGIRKIKDLKDRCVIDHETDCWIWAGARKGKNTRVWIPQINNVRSVTWAVEWLCTGQAPERRSAWVPLCGRADCANPKHRKPGTRSEFFKAVMPSVSASTRAKQTAIKRNASVVCTPEIAAVIRASDETLAALAERYNMAFSTVSKIRLGRRWAEGCKGSSVWGLAA